MENFMGDIEVPERLSNEDQEKYLRLFSETRDSYYRNYLVEHNLRLVMDIVKSILKKNPTLDKNELFSRGCEGLIKAVDKYDISLGKRLSTFAYHCIYTELSDYFSYNNSLMRKGEVLSLETPIIYNKNGDKLFLKNIIEDEKENVEEIYERKLFFVHLNKFLSTLTYKDRLMFEMTFGLNGYEETTLRGIALNLGIHYTYVSTRNIINIKRLKKYLCFLGYSIDDFEKEQSLCKNKASSY